MIARMIVRRVLLVCLFSGISLGVPWIAGRSSWAQEHAFPEDAALAGTLLPAALMLKAPPLLQAGKGEEATFWFYAGQLRYRSYLAAHPDIDPTGDPALFASLLDIVGRPVNEYAFGDIPELARTIDAVLDWDKRYGDPSLPSETHEPIRLGLAGLRDDILARADFISEQRAKNGLPNR